MSSNNNTESLLHDRLNNATKAELSRLSHHLGIPEDSSINTIEITYSEAADNSLFNAIRPLINNDTPTYSKVLRLLYCEMRSFTESLDESWQRVKSLKPWEYASPIDEMSDQELESKILEIYQAEYHDSKDKLKTDPSFWKRITGALPSLSTIGGGAATAATASAWRLPFLAAPATSIAGPIAITLGVVLLGAKMAGPAYKKIIPATVELMLIQKRIDSMPQEL